MLNTFFSRKWIFATLLVLGAIAVMLRLGKWQLDRLEQRRAFNSHYLIQLEQPPLELTSGTVDLDLGTMAYREVRLSGEYDHTQQVAIRNQSYKNRPGVHLLTPFFLSGSRQAVLIDRGWIPLEDYQSGDWSSFSEPGSLTVHGILRLSQSKPALGGRPDPTPEPGARFEAWNFVNVEAIAAQIPYPVLGAIYIQNAPDPNHPGLPYRSQPEIDISEGPHLSYAIQWFAFSTVLALGYPYYVRREIQAPGP